MSGLTLEQIIVEATDTSEEKGFFETLQAAADQKGMPHFLAEVISRLALVSGEVHEAIEELRKRNPSDKKFVNDRPLPQRESIWTMPSRRYSLGILALPAALSTF